MQTDILEKDEFGDVSDADIGAKQSIAVKCTMRMQAQRWGEPISNMRI